MAYGLWQMVDGRWRLTVFHRLPFAICYLPSAIRYVSHRAAANTCATISPRSQIAREPACPVAETTQPIAQPAWVLMHTVRRSLAEPLTSS